MRYAQKYGMESHATRHGNTLQNVLTRTVLKSSPEKVEEAEDLDGQADDGVPREHEEKSDRENDRPSQLRALSGSRDA